MTDTPAPSSGSFPPDTPSLPEGCSSSPDDSEGQDLGHTNVEAIPSRRFRLTIAYDGSYFHGWQKQHPPGQEPLRTVQGVVEDVLVKMMGQRVNLVGASRTDARVHAMGQVAQFDARTRIPVERISEAINSRLPHDVQILDCRVADDHFDAIRQARIKQYRYRIYNAHHRPLHHRNHVYHCWWPLDLAKMNQAAAMLVGTHDFAAFTTVNHGRETTVRTIFHCRVERHPLSLPEQSGLEEIPSVPLDLGVHGGQPVSAPVGGSPVGGLPHFLPLTPSEYHIVVQGSGFLYNMVRILAGTLVEVGRGAALPQSVTDAIASRDRRQAGPTLPPQGLWLEWIRYE